MTLPYNDFQQRMRAKRAAHDTSHYHVTEPGITEDTIFPIREDAQAFVDDLNRIFPVGEGSRRSKVAGDATLRFCNDPACEHSGDWMFVEFID